MEFAEIGRVQVTDNERDTNELLSQGWVLLSVASGKSDDGEGGMSPRFRYCLGQPYDESKEEPG
jgi:hypothetical protein